MFISTLLRGRFILIAALALVLATAAYGFAAANTVTTSNAGDGEGTVSGYTVTTTYDLNSSNPTLIDTINLSVAPDSSGTNASHVQVRLYVNGAWGAWAAASGSSASTSWTLDVSSANLSASDLTKIEVAAAS